MAEGDHDDDGAATRPCPWCGETILAVARKCKHCLEYLEPEDALDEPTLPEEIAEAAERSSAATERWTWDQSGGYWRCDAHGSGSCRVCLPKPSTGANEATNAALICPTCRAVFPTSRERYLHGVNEHGSTETRAPSGQGSGRGGNRYTGAMGSRRPLSSVGDRADDGSLRCPRCGGSQFTAKRSNTGKTIGIATLGVGGLIAPKSQVKCVACGLKFKRG